jgi:hypothetical protein
LVEVMAAGEAVAADQVRVLPLEIEWREGCSAEHSAFQTGRVRFEDVHHLVRIGLVRLIPATRCNGLSGVAANLGWQNSDLNPEHVLARRRAGGIDRRWLADDQSRFSGQESGCRFGVDTRHHFKVGGDMDVSEFA